MDKLIRMENDGWKPFACTVCNHPTTFKHLLRSHEVRPSEEKSVKFNCSGCTFSCKSEALLRVHVLRRHTVRTFKCDSMGCLFAAASGPLLQRHKKIVHEKVRKCPNCDFRAAYPSRIRRHNIEQHNANPTILCPNKGCAFEADDREKLNKHKESHSRSNLGCPMEGCGYVTTSKFAWKRHMQFHDPTGRPFPCPLCFKRFPSNQRLSEHLQSHTNEKSFKCPACDFEAASKRAVTGHVTRIHSTAFPAFVVDEKSTCDHCGINYGCTRDLAMHRMKLKTAVVMLPRLQIKYKAL